MNTISLRSSRISLLNAIFISLIVILIGAAVFVYYTEYIPSHSPPLPLSGFQIESITITNSSIDSSLKGLVYVASTLQQQIQGFQNASRFGNCNGFSVNATSKCIGMIFVTSNTQSLCFWMHDTPLSLQQVWISSGGVVTAIYQAQAESDNSVCHNAKDVLETNTSLPIDLGDVVSLEKLD